MEIKSDQKLFERLMVDESKGKDSTERIKYIKWLEKIKKELLKMLNDPSKEVHSS